MRKGILLTILASILCLAVILSTVTILGVYQIGEIEILPKTKQNSDAEDGQLYFMVGPKYVPIAAQEMFKKYGINLKLTPEEKEIITSLEDFFAMGGEIPEDTDRFAKNPNDYELLITGNVEKNISISYSDLITKFEWKQMVTELYCMPSLNGTGKFEGPSLYDVVNYAKPTDNTSKIIFVAGDGYQKGWGKRFTISELENHKEDYVLALAMNGYPLSIEHGYPARLALDSQQGALWVKWVITIVIVDEDAKREDYIDFIKEN